MKSLILTLILYVLFLLQIAVAPVLNLDFWNVNFIVPFLTVLTVFRPLKETLFWGVLAGLIIDALSLFTFDWGFIFIPILVSLGRLFYIKLWQRKGNLTASVLITALYWLIIAFFVLLTKERLIGGESNNSINFLTSNYKSLGINLLKALLVNCLILTPIYYFTFKRLNELFEYWQQRKTL